MHERESKVEVISVEVWERPVRVTHWLMTLAILVLGITGFLIGRPPFSAPTEASETFSLGTIRFIHVVAGYVLLATFLVRLYWGFVGNRFCRWTTMLPITRRRWKGIAEETGDLLYPRGTFRVYRGHTPLANVSYLVAYLGVLLSVITGFTLHAHAHYSAFWRTIAAWGLWLFGNNLNTVRLVHHLTLWFFAVFLIVHLYLVIYTTVFSRSTGAETMISGKKLLLREELSEHED